MRKQKAREYRGYRTAGIRLSDEILPEADQHRTDRLLVTLYAIHQFDKAHLVMLAEEGLIPCNDAVAMLRVLRETEREGFEKARLEAGGGMHSAEHLLIRRLGEEVGGRIHLGRSSGDLNAMANRVAQRDRLLEVMAELNELRALLLPMAEAHSDTVMPSYTHGQHAQPVTLGHQLAAWASVLERSFERLLQAYRRINVSPVGAAIGTGSDFPVNRHRTCELLGFDRPASNTFDAILMSHDLLLDAFYALTMLNVELSRWADDLTVWSSHEFGMVEIPDRFCGSSSIMMQKKNAYALEHMKGLADASVGGLMAAFLSARGGTGWISVNQRQYTVDTLWRVYTDTLRDIKWWRQLLPEIRWNSELMRERVGQYWAQATDIAGALVREKGLPWRTAHQIVGILVRYGYERGVAPAGTTSALLDEAAVEYMGKPVGLSEESLRKALDPMHFVGTRTLYGGTAPSEVRRQIGDCRATLEHDEAQRAAAFDQVKKAQKNLEAAIDALLVGDQTAPGARL